MDTPSRLVDGAEKEQMYPRACITMTTPGGWRREGVDEPSTSCFLHGEKNAPCNYTLVRQYVGHINGYWKSRFKCMRFTLFSHSLVIIMRKSWSKDPNNRPSAEEIFMEVQRLNDTFKNFVALINVQT